MSQPESAVLNVVKELPVYEFCAQMSYWLVRIRAYDGPDTDTEGFGVD